MRLTSRQRRTRREGAPRIAISQAEITADLNYPAAGRADPAPARIRRSRRR